MILASSFLQSQSLRDVLYIVAFALFIQGLRGLSGPTTAVRGNRIAAVGMTIAAIATACRRRCSCRAQSAIKTTRCGAASTPDSSGRATIRFPSTTTRRGPLNRWPFRPE